MGLYDKYARLAGERLQFSDNGLTPFGTCIDEVYSATEGRIGNKKVILAGTNNYLGLTFNHDAIREGQAALAAQGTGTTGSRMANGSYAPHLALEKEIAEFFNRPTAIVFSTGYTANLGVISTLADHNAVVLLDADSHASPRPVAPNTPNECASSTIKYPPRRRLISTISASGATSPSIL